MWSHAVEMEPLQDTRTSPRFAATADVKKTVWTTGGTVLSIRCFVSSRAFFVEERILTCAVAPVGIVKADEDVAIASNNVVAGVLDVAIVHKAMTWARSNEYPINIAR